MVRDIVEAGQEEVDEGRAAEFFGSKGAWSAKTHTRPSPLSSRVVGFVIDSRNLTSDLVCRPLAGDTAAACWLSGRTPRIHLVVLPSAPHIHPLYYILA